MSDQPRSASEEFSRLTDARVRAEARVRELEAEQRQAGVTLTATSEALAEFERRGDGKQAERTRLERELAEAKAAVAAPWAERIEGARRRARDARGEVQRFVTAHLAELVQARQVDGQAAADRINSAVSEMLAAYAEWAAVSQEISTLLSLVGPVRPGDVSFTRSEALAREASRLVQQGGEQAPVLRHSPGVPQHGRLAERPASAVA